MRSIESLGDVVDWGLCVGCGACFYSCDSGGISLVNVEAVGIRPQFSKPSCAECSDCLQICPGYFVDAAAETAAPNAPTPAEHEFGPVLEIWEGHASDEEVRFEASSGGVVSALAIYCLEREQMESVVHTAMNENQPWLNRTVQSRSREEIIERAGSRYAPASPCEGLAWIEQGERPGVFIGKPCDTTAVSHLRKQRPELDKKLGLVLTFFCAGTPSTQGTLDQLKQLDLTPEEIDTLKYRGAGWPGRFRALYRNRTKEKSKSYRESWSELARTRPFRCQLCPDGLGRVADISCGDAWDKFNEDGDIGRSIVLVRTERGREILRRAAEAGYVTLKPIKADQVLAAQPNLLEKRHLLFGRLLAMRLLWIPIPRFQHFSLFRSWWKLPFAKRIRTILGTLRRLLQRGLWRKNRFFKPPQS